MRRPVSYPGGGSLRSATSKVTIDQKPHKHVDINWPIFRNSASSHVARLAAYPGTAKFVAIASIDLHDAGQTCIDVIARQHIADDTCRRDYK